ncbi:hypothetical protein D3C87_1472310 [compost metagenome]
MARTASAAAIETVQVTGRKAIPIHKSFQRGAGNTAVQFRPAARIRPRIGTTAKAVTPIQWAKRAGNDAKTGSGPASPDSIAGKVIRAEKPTTQPSMTTSHPPADKSMGLPS